jgi:putative ABC transport system substrate-binding protein
VIKRREFIAGLSGAAAWSVVAWAQQLGGIRRVGLLLNLTEANPVAQAYAEEFRRGMTELGWQEGRNLQIDYRFAGGDGNRYSRDLSELIALSPAVIVAGGFPLVRPLQQATRDVAIVVVGIIDPVAAGLAASLTRPGGNVTGFSVLEYGMSGKYLELLKEISPSTTRVAVLRDPTAPGGTGQFGALQAVAPFLKVEVSPLDVREADEIERGVANFARTPNAGLVLFAGARANVHRELIIAVAARHRLPAIYPDRTYAAAGGLFSYGTVLTGLHHRAASYVDRILKGEKPADLPIQAPTKYELIVNLRTAKALGLAIPETLLATADEVIQ